jgi:hypothetical protein
MTSSPTTGNAAGSRFSRPRVALWLAAFAFWIRLAGLSHDLHVGQIYHPDTPKQVRAVEEFLRGQYLTVRDHPDYDGYPLFHSHLAEMLVRAERAVRRAVAWQTIGPEAPAPEPLPVRTIFWLMRGMNAFLGAASVALVFLIGRRLGAATGWIAALWMMVSPLDFTASHYAAGDTAAGFFVLAAILFSLRISETGRFRDYALAALCVTAAFSSKYHGGMAAASVACGHFARWGFRGGLASPGAWRRIAWTAVAAAAGLLLTSPALLVHPSQAWKNLIAFFQWTADFGLSDEVRALPWPARFRTGCLANWPILARALGSIAVAGVGLALLLRARSAWFWIVSAVPLIHLTLGVGGKPHLHAVHHVPAMGALFLLGAAGLTAAGGLRPGLRWVALALAVLAGARNAQWTGREAFFFRHNDTRRLAETWALGNRPHSVDLDTGRYTFSAPERPAQSVARIEVWSGRSAPVRSQVTPWFSIALDGSPFTVFRNRDQHFLVSSNRWLRPGATAPFFNAQPAERPDDLLVAELPEWTRTVRSRAVARDRPVRATLTLDHRLDRAWLLVRTGSDPARLDARLGGRAHSGIVPANSARCVTLESPDALRLKSRDRFFYRWSASVRWGHARLTLAVTPGEAGEWCFRNGLWSEAARLLEGAAPEADPLRARMAALARRKAGLSADLPAFELLTAERIAEAYGIHPALAAHLPLLTIRSEDWTESGTDGGVWTDRPVFLPAGARQWIGPEWILSPGFYTLEMPAGGPAHTWDFLTAADLPWTPVPVRLEGDPERPALRRVTFFVPRDRCVLRLRLLGPALDPARRPEVRLTSSWMDDARGLDRWLEEVPILGTSGPGFFQGLEKAGTELAPPTRSFPVAARFSGGLSLRAIHFQEADLAPGGRLGVQLEWDEPTLPRRPDRLAVWLHVLDAQGRIVAQGDRPLWPDLRRAGCAAGTPRRWSFISLPADLPPGAYSLRFGVWNPATRRRLNILSSEWESDRKGILWRDLRIRD